MNTENQYCTFYLDNHYLGIPVMQVQEIIRHHEISDVPLAPDMISGLINLRGQIVTTIDLRKKLDLQKRSENEIPMNIVIQHEGEAISFLVDRIGDVLELPDAIYEDPPQTLTGKTRELISGTYKLDDKLLLVLNTDKAIEVS